MPPRPRNGDAAAVGAMRAAKDADERRLAGPVLAHHRMNLAWPHFKVDIVEGDRRVEALGYAVGSQCREVHAGIKLWVRLAERAADDCNQCGIVSIRIRGHKPPPAVDLAFQRRYTEFVAPRVAKIKITVPSY